MGLFFWNTHGNCFKINHDLTLTIRLDSIEIGQNELTQSQLIPCWDQATNKSNNHLKDQRVLGANKLAKQLRMDTTCHVL